MTLAPKAKPLYLLHITLLLLEMPKFRILVVPSLSLQEQAPHNFLPLLRGWRVAESRQRSCCGFITPFQIIFLPAKPIPKRPTQTPHGPGAQPRFDAHLPSALHGGKRIWERHQTYNVRKPLLNPIMQRKREHRPASAYVEVDEGVRERYWAAFTEPLKIGGLFYFSLHSDLNQQGHGRTDARSALTVLVSSWMQELGHEEQHKLF